MDQNKAYLLDSRWIRAIGLSVVLAVMLYLGAILMGDAAAVWHAIGRLSAAAWLLVLGTSLFNYVLRYLRWHGYLLVLGHRIPKLRHLMIYLAGFTLTTTPGKAGEVLRSVYLAPYGVRYVHSVAALFTERLVDFVAILLLAACVVLDFDGYTGWLASLVLAVLAALWILQSAWFLSMAEWWVGRAPENTIRSLARKLLSMVEASIRLLRPPLLAGGLFLGLLSWGAEGVGFYIILQALEVDVSLTMAMGIYAMGVLVGALSFIPGGLGSTEAAMGGLLVLAGVGVSESIAATLICRIATLWFAVVLGAIALGSLTLRPGPEIES